MISLRVCVDVDDMERALGFYVGALGFTVSRRFAPEWVELGGGSAPIDLLLKPTQTSPSPGATEQRRYTRHWTPVHLDVVVTAIDEAVNRCVAAGAVLEAPVRDSKWGRLALLADPFGHGVCLLEFRGRGYDELIT